MKYKWIGILALGVAVVGAACGGDDDDGGDNNEQAATETGLKAAVEDATQAFLDDDPKASYAALTKACRERVAYAEFTGQLAIGKALFEGIYDVKLSEIEVTGVDIRNFTNTSAEARVLLRSKDDPALDLSGGEGDFETWRFEDGEWRSEDCVTT